MAAGSWPRLIIGLLLSLEVIRLQLMGGETSLAAIALAIIFILLTAAYFAFKF